MHLTQPRRVSERGAGDYVCIYEIGDKKSEGGLVCVPHGDIEGDIVKH
jgi:hypothetical protein